MASAPTYTLSSSELRARLAATLADVEAGATVTVTRSGRVVAVLAPPGAPSRPPLDLSAVRARFRGGPTVLEALDADRAEGR